ncbi:LOG family protein [Nitrosophilus kaiyonis]|uniref:LOG family protein n=1 Tax=Nitrosophilus kaiyonis TaxID=2930200 RepID=UPI00249124D4|nr:LOG family protein [Nitrosophilus kaiyonis]
MKFATTFGASVIDKNSKEYKDGIELGFFLAKNGYIVKCGGYGGLMEAVSIGVKKAKGECIGVTIQKFDEIRLKNPYLTKKITTDNLFDRLKILIQDSKLFIAQKGSIGTLNEIFMVAALKYGKFMPDIRIVLIGKEYKNFNCFDENFLKIVEFYDSVDEFINS